MKSYDEGSRLRLTLLSFAVAGASWSAPAHAAVVTYNVCINWQITTNDSAQPVSGGPDNGLIEDMYTTCNGSCLVTARGVRFKMSQGAYKETKDSNPITGCAQFNVTNPPNNVFDITVYAYATDANNNYVRMHDAPNEIRDGGDYYPGKTISHTLVSTTLIPGTSQSTIVSAGGNGPDWTGMAAAAFTLYRYHDGVSNKQFHIGSNSTVCADGTAHFNGTGYSSSAFESNSLITSGQHYLRVGTCSSGGTPYSRGKFIVAHEMGHALLALYYGGQGGASNFTEPSVDMTNTAATFGNYCYGGPGGGTYSMFSQEWNSLNFREGYAHFIASRVWNDKALSGSFRLFAKTFDLRRYGPGWSGVAADWDGGLLEHVCNGSPAGASTDEDYMRFLWDFYNSDSGVNCTGGEQPTNEQMLKLYAQTRLNGGLQSFNYGASMSNAAQGIGLPACLATAGINDEYRTAEVHNGLDN